MMAELNTTERSEDKSVNRVRLIVDKITKDIWKANQNYCEVCIRSAYLEEHFVGEYHGSKETYEAVVTNK